MPEARRAVHQARPVCGLAESHPSAAVPAHAHGSLQILVRSRRHVRSEEGVGQAEGEEPDDDDDGRRRSAAVGEEQRQEGEYPRLCEVEQGYAQGMSVGGGGPSPSFASSACGRGASRSSKAECNKFGSSGIA